MSKPSEIITNHEAFPDSRLDAIEFVCAVVEAIFPPGDDLPTDSMTINLVLSLLDRIPLPEGADLHKILDSVAEDF